MRYLIFQCLILLFHLLSQAVTANAQNATPHRLEDELSFNLPDGDYDRSLKELQHYLTGRLVLHNEPMQVAYSSETFFDTYYGESSKELLQSAFTLRHRRRYVDKEIKELVQLKFGVHSSSQDHRSLQREIKYRVSNPTVVPGIYPPPIMTDLLKVIKGSDVPVFTNDIKKLGVSQNKLRPLLSIEQKRNRLYLSSRGSPMFTISLDRVSSSRGLHHVTFTQLDIEISENIFGQAPPNEREALTSFRKQLLEHTKRYFPNLEPTSLGKLESTLLLLDKTTFFERICQFLTPENITVIILLIFFLFLSLLLKTNC